MLTIAKPLLEQTADDLMSEPLIVIPQEMSLQGAAHLLSEAQISGAPVVDAEGRCIGVLSATDFLRWVEKGEEEINSRALQPSVCFPWQILDPESLPKDAVTRYMTADPVMVAPSTRITRLARMMLDAHIHRVIVVEGEARPVGIVSTTDMLAALAYAEREG